MKKDIYKTYNQITKEFDVVIMTNQEIKRLDKNKKYIVLLQKKDVVYPPRKPKQRQKSTRELLLEFMEKQEKFNKAILERLDRYDQLFKEHGWIK